MLERGESAREKMRQPEDCRLSHSQTLPQCSPRWQWEANQDQGERGVGRAESQPEWGLGEGAPRENTGYRRPVPCPKGPSGQGPLGPGTRSADVEGVREKRGE